MGWKTLYIGTFPHRKEPAITTGIESSASQKKPMSLQRLRRALEPVIRPLVHFYWRWSRGATLGARAVVIDGSGRVFLVKHSYVDGWHLPGGGVETGETMLEALARELAEEGNIRLDRAADAARPVLQQARVAARPCGAVHRARVPPGRRGRCPIVKSSSTDSFALDGLPADTSRATRARLAEVFDGVAVSEVW